MRNKILNDVANKKITPSQALEKLYGRKPRKGRFIKVFINIKESKGLTAFINLILMMPVPIIFGKIFIIKYMKKNNIPIEIYDELISTCGGTSVIVKSRESNVKVKIF